MKLRFSVYRVANGYVITDGSEYGRGSPVEGSTHVAQDWPAMLQVVKQLCPLSDDRELAESGKAVIAKTEAGWGMRPEGQ